MQSNVAIRAAASVIPTLDISHVSAILIFYVNTCVFIRSYLKGFFPVYKCDLSVRPLLIHACPLIRLYFVIYDFLLRGFPPNQRTT